ncbi:MAG: endonuclease MutS2 [Lachnospiraceae bacterium]|nr:endonuclease MutS2 [Lachnospiraceae bacterium]
MNKRALHTLEFDKIITILADYATCPGGRIICEHTEPTDNIEEIKRLQSQTTDALTRVLRSGSLSFSGTRDISESVKRLEIGSTLGITELLNISSVLKVAARAKSFSRKEESAAQDSIDYMFEALEPLTPLNNDITRCIISEEEISDEASPTLKDIRRHMKLTGEQIHTQLNNIVNSQSAKTYLQDNVITMRNGRYCIPVKQEYKNQVSGMVHDQSQTGSTVFIEPMAIVKLNNELKELSLKEKDEIEVILSNLSVSCAEHAAELDCDYRMLNELDAIFARAMFSKAIKGSEPVFSHDRYINIKQGRHPLIPADKVVPINIYLGKDFNLLIVTGPNTGGKTVSLKTVGLLTLMGQSGLHIPADSGSSLAVFREVYADIGDEQSIEQSLSTFSSHMTHIVEILKYADSDSLVLFDELGAGTDPVEGAALATAILSFFQNIHVRTMATTHYSELKLFALTTPGVENASCEFSLETLKPTYRLLIGIPGKSNAFAISSKLGLPDFIIDEARKHIDEDSASFEDIISDLEQSKTVIENERLEIEHYKKEIEALKQKLEKKHEHIDDRRESILRSANEEAAKILRETKEFADKTIRDINKASKSGDTKELENSRRKTREKLDKTTDKLVIKPKHTPHKSYSIKDFKLGDRVKVLSMNVEGTVHSLPNSKGDLTVQMGILCSKVNISDLIILEDEPGAGGGGKAVYANTSKIKMSKSSSITSEIKLLGMTVDEAIAVLDKYLDDAYLSHIPSVRIVHGKGTGALRNAVHKHLQKCKYVSEYHIAEYGEGDAGVTIAVFR